MTTAKETCNIMWKLFNRAAEPFGVEYSNATDDTTENIIIFYGEYYKLYLDSL